MAWTTSATFFSAAQSSRLCAVSLGSLINASPWWPAVATVLI
jgi:hypothetical protein